MSKFYEHITESVWSNIQSRSVGDSVRREDDVNHMDFDAFADYIEGNYSERSDWFAVVDSDDGKSRHIDIDIIIYGEEIDLSFNVVEGEIYNILVQGDSRYVDIPGLKEIFNVNVLGSFKFSVVEKDWSKSNNTFVKLIDFYLKKKTNESVWNYIKRNCTSIKEFKDKYSDNLNECEGVPGGTTPANVGGMGAAYFPGPNGELGSGDLPSPTGVVYHQVAPFGVFIKELKKKKKKKKFRKEDEPCSHSPNAKVYDYVDDYREYVDRTYTMMNKK